MVDLGRERDGGWFEGVFVGEIEIDEKSAALEGRSVLRFAKLESERYTWYGVPSGPSMYTFHLYRSDSSTS
jgi:hypothetical protein